MNAYKWILIILFSFLFQTTIAQQNKRALIIAIGDYPKETDWPRISSVNDISIISHALAKQGFGHIDSIKNAQATKEGMITALEKLAQNTQTGDIVVVHISAHGQQIDDNNGDELDGYDEAIVAYGAPMYSDDGYNGENHLRDEELGELLDNIRAKCGKQGDVLVFIDACHSGTGTRGEEKARGGAEPIHVRTKNVQIRNGESNNQLLENTSQSRGSNAPLSPMVVFSGASANERNFEYKGYGSLSTALARSFQNVQTQMSYQEFWANVMKEMSLIAPNQQPVIEGDLSREIFGGKAVQTPKYYTLQSVNNNYVTLFGGMINGLFKGTEFAVYPAGTLDIKGKTPLAKGTLTFCEYNFAAGNMVGSLPDKLVNYWVFITKQTFGDVQLETRLAVESKSLQNRLKSELSDFGLINLSSKSPEFELNDKEGKLQLVRLSNGVVLKDNIATADSFLQLKEVITTYLQGKFINELEIKDPSIQVELTLVPVAVVNGRVIDTFPLTNYTQDGVIQFRDGDKVRLRVTNKGTKEAYFTILDIDANGKITSIVPNVNNNEDPKNFKLEKGQSMLVDRKVITFRKPVGKETIKIIASHDPLNLGPIVASRGASESRGSERSLEKLFRNAFKASTRGDVDELLPDTEANTSSVIVEIVN